MKRRLFWIAANIAAGRRPVNGGMTPTTSPRITMSSVQALCLRVHLSVRA